MKKLLVLVCAILINLNAYAQKYDDKESIDVNKLKPKEYYSIQNKGWVVLEDGPDAKQLANFSNKNFLLYISLNCKSTSDTPPSYLIEYNNNYGDKEWGGLDFASSGTDNFLKTTFLVDGKEVENPFVKITDKKMATLKEALKKGKTFTMKFFDSQFDPNTGKDALKLNREISFELKNSQLLDVATYCKKKETDEVETTVVQ